MSTPIRPPGGPALPSVGGIEGPAGIEGVQPGQVADVGEVGRTASPTSASQVQSPTASVLARLEAGEVTREQAVESLVGQALEAHGAGALPPAQRQELASILRASLLDDPTLGRLLGDA